jgi:hypothetical protein
MDNAQRCAAVCVARPDRLPRSHRSPTCTAPASSSERGRAPAERATPTPSPLSRCASPRGDCAAAGGPTFLPGRPAGSRHTTRRGTGVAALGHRRRKVFRVQMDQTEPIGTLPEGSAAPPTADRRELDCHEHAGVLALGRLRPGAPLGVDTAGMNKYARPCLESSAECSYGVRASSQAVLLSHSDRMFSAPPQECGGGVWDPTRTVSSRCRRRQYRCRIAGPPER